jgi:hypothetical protein
MPMSLYWQAKTSGDYLAVKQRSDDPGTTPRCALPSSFNKAAPILLAQQVLLHFAHGIAG